MEPIKDFFGLTEDLPFRVLRNIRKFETMGHCPYFHLHDCFEITCVIKGEITYYVNNEKLELHENDIILFNNTEPHAWKEGVYELLEIIFIPKFLIGNHPSDFDMQYIKPFEDLSINFKNKLSANSEAAAEIKKILLQIESENQEKKIGYKQAIRSLLLLIPTLLLRDDRSLRKSLAEDVRKDLNHGKLQMVLKYINENFNESIDLKKISELAFMNYFYFSQFFKEMTGKSFTQYLSDLRLEYALVLLKETKKPILEIIEESGFGNPSNFYRAFQKKYGVSPTNYRKILKNS